MVKITKETVKFIRSNGENDWRGRTNVPDRMVKMRKQSVKVDKKYMIKIIGETVKIYLKV